MSDRHFWCFFLPFVYRYPSSCPCARCTPNKSVPTLCYTCRHGPIYIYIYSSMPVGTYQVQSLGPPKIVYCGLKEGRSLIRGCYGHTDLFNVQTVFLPPQSFTYYCTSCKHITHLTELITKSTLLSGAVRPRVTSLYMLFLSLSVHIIIYVEKGFWTSAFKRKVTSPVVPLYPVPAWWTSLYTFPCATPNSKHWFTTSFLQPLP